MQRLFLWLATVPTLALSPREVLVVANERHVDSTRTAEHYLRKRLIPLANYCRIRTEPVEEITRVVYARDVEGAVRECLARRGAGVVAIVLMPHVPLKIAGAGEKMRSTAASVDSELALLYARDRGVAVPVEGPASNPFFGQRETPFAQARFPIYLVTRLAAQTASGALRLIDDALAAERDGRVRKGKIVLDLHADNDQDGNNWLRNAAILLPKDRVVFDASAAVLQGVRDVVGYASWGSNDSRRRERRLGNTWLPGAIATEYVSTNARTFAAPPQDWNLGTWLNSKTWFAGAPQSLTSDYLAEGATAATGHVYEPYLGFTPRPDYLLPAYLLRGRPLAEAFYLSIPALSWMNVCVGDPLLRLPASY